MRGAIAPKIAALGGALAALGAAPAPAGAVVVVSGGNGLTMRPQLGYVGSWNGASAVAIGPDWIISARHVGGAPGTLFTLDGIRYQAHRVVNHPTQDLMLAQLTEPLPGWHDLAPLPAAGDRVALGGMGFQAGNFLGNGYDWSAGTGLAWGFNTIDAVGARIAITFDPRSSPRATEGEAIFTMLDSGGGIFAITDDDQFQLAGIAVSITGGFGQSLFGSRAFAVNLDPVRAWITSHVSPGEPIASSIAPPRGMQLPGSPPVPAPSAAILLLAGGTLAAVRRRR